MLCHYFILIGATALLLNAPRGMAQESDFNHINPDGSFSFGLKVNDPGGHYHEASGNPKSIIRGRYGSRNPSNGRVEETVYTAGRRGFRARGPTIHRKMDLSQIPRGPIGTPEDPQADPFEDPSYGFGFKTPSYSRREDQDRFARLNGMYSYVDDVGERHLVKYSGSSQNGFEIHNAFPDAPQNVHYSRSLYKDPNPRARGRMSMQRKNNGQYSYISAGPDQRRSESIGADGITRGSYSYLDDKGVQRTVQYIAGAGIGYRVVQSTTGPGTHNLPRPVAPEFGVHSPQSNDLAPESLFFDDTPNPGFSKGSPLSPPPPSDGKNSFSGNDDDDGGDTQVYNGNSNSGGSQSNRGGSPFSRGTSRGSSSSSSSRGGSSSSSSRGGKTPSFNNNGDSGDVNSIFNPRAPGNSYPPAFPIPPPPQDYYRGNRRPLRPLDGTDPNAILPEIPRPRPPTPTPPSPPLHSNRPLPPNNSDFRPTPPPYPEYFSVNSIDFDKARIRAHVQNIDLLPISPRYPSPGDALKWDIISGH